MKKLLTLLMLLCMVCAGAWAQTLPPFTFTSWDQNSWTTMGTKGTNVTSNIKDVIYKVYEDKTLSGDFRMTVKYQQGNRRRYINGVELLQDNRVVYSKYERKHDNADATGAVYEISNVAEGSYTIRIWSSRNTDNEWADNRTRVNITCGGTAIVTNNDILVGDWFTGDNSVLTDGLKAVCTSVGLGLKDGKIKYKEETVTFTEPGRGTVNYNYTGAASSTLNEQLDILGFEVLNEAGTKVVSSDAHYGYTGTNYSNRDYTYTIPAAGTYKVRTWIDGVREPYSVGTVTYTFSSFDGIYEINNQSGSVSRGYFVHSANYPNAPVLAETQLNNYTNRDVTDDRHDGTVNPYFGVKTINGKTYIYSLANGKFLNTRWSDTAVGYTMALSSRNSSYVTLQNTNQSGNQFLCNACGNNGGVDGHTIYTGNNDGGNDFVFEPVDASEVAELQTTYAANIAAAEFAINGGWTMVCTGLTSPAEGGVTYLCKNYTGAKAMLPLNLDRDGLIAMHVSGYNGTIQSVDEESHTITVAYDQNYTETSVLWDGNGDVSNTKLPAARIPAMVKAHNGDILAFSDWRYSRDDVGRSSHGLGYQVDIEMRRSSNNGQTWSPAIIVANGDGGSNLTTAGYGDASVVADSESDNVLLMCVNAAASNRFVRYTSSDNGANWSGPVNIAEHIATVAPGCTFFTSGKMVQSRDFKAQGATYKRIYAPLCGGTADYVIYSDDFGQTWHTLGTSAAQTGTNNECRLVELPNGDILLDSRDGSARRINVFTYTNRETGEGTWGEQDQAGNMPTVDCNGDIDLVTGYAAGSEQPVKILLETMPRGGYNGGSRAHVQYYYKVLTENQYTLNDLKSGWVAGLEVCAGKSAYSSIIDLGNGSEAILYEKAHSDSETGYNGNPWGYDIKFETHTLSQITKGAYTHEPTSVLTINYTLTDMNGQTYEGSYQSAEKIAPTFTGAYGYTLNNEQWGEVVDNTVTYAADINFGFPVSSNNVNKWVNLIYLPNYDRYISYDGSNAYMALQNRPDNANDPGTDKGKSNYLWSVIPVLEEGTNNFGFKIYNKKAQMYASAAGMAHNANVTLAAEGDVFHLIAPTATPANATHKNTNKGVFVKQSGDNTFSISVTSAKNSVCLTYWNVTTSSHAGQNLDIVEAVPDAYTITYNISYNGKVIGTQTVEIARGEMPSGITVPDYITVGEYTPALTACAEDATYSVATSPTVGVFPFWGENVYSLRLHKSPLPFAVYVDPIDQTSVKSVIRNNNNVYYTQPNRENYQYYNWQFAGDWLNGYTIKNQATSKYISYGEAGVNNTNNTNATLVAQPEAGAYFDLEHNGGNWFFKVHGSTSNYMSNYTDANRTLATYNVQNYNYDRSKVLIGSPETNVLNAESATELKNEITEVVNKIIVTKQVGYPCYGDDAPQENKDKFMALYEYIMNTEINNDNYDQAAAALKEVCKLTNVYMPELKGSYRVAFLLPNGTKKYISKQSVSGKVTEEASEAAIFTLGKSQDFNNGGPSQGFKYILVDEDARFLSTNSSNTGVRTDYADGCGFALVKAAQYETQSSYNRYTIQQHLACFSLVMAANNDTQQGGAWCPVYLTADGNITSNNSCWVNGVPEGATTAIVLETVTNENNLKLTRPTTNVTDNTGLNGKFVGTFSSPFNVQLPAGVVAYTARAVDGSVTFNRLGSIVPKNTGVLVYAGDAGQTINEGAEPTHESVEELQEMVEDSDNALVGTNGSALQVPADVNAFILSKDQEKGVMFYALNTDENKRTIARNKAYLVVSQGQSVGAFKFDFEDVVTAIEQLNAEQTNGITFDLSGRSVKARQRGLYIVGGKKVIR